MESRVIFKIKVREFVKGFYDVNDPAHRLEHADEVCYLAESMNLKLGLNLNPKEIILAAYFHDIMAWDRKVHHERAYDFVMKAYIKFFEEDKDLNREKIALACLEHRASWKGEFSSKLSELISSADRGAPKFEDKLKRTLDYGNNYENGIKHLMEKYGPNGYVKYPKIYKDYFKEGIEEMKKEILKRYEEVMGV